LGSAMSVAVTENVTTAPSGPVASTVWLFGTVSFGGVVSRTVISKLFELSFPRLSVAVQVTSLTLIGKKLPEAGVQVGVTLPSTRSVADAEYATVAPPASSASTVKSSGTVMSGPVVSWTVTVKLPFPVFPDESVAEQLTVDCPSGNVDPAA